MPGSHDQTDSQKPHDAEGSSQPGDSVRDSSRERDDLRREMESHLSMLEEDERRSGAGRTDATRAAEDRFGDAVAHFRHSLAEMDRRQAHLRNAVIALAFAALLVTAAGIVANLMVLGDLRATIDAWSARADPVTADFSRTRYPSVLLEASWETPHGVATRDIAILRSTWDEVVAGVTPSCQRGEWPVLSLTIDEDSAAKYQYHVGAPIGTRVTITPRSAFQMGRLWRCRATPRRKQFHSGAMSECDACGLCMDWRGRLTPLDFHSDRRRWRSARRRDQT